MEVWLQIIVGVVTFTLGFFLRQSFDVVIRKRARKRKAIQELLRLDRLLVDTGWVFTLQCQKRDQLSQLLQDRASDEYDLALGYDEAFRNSWEKMKPSERELFAVIRGTTSHSMYRGNSALREWADTFSARELIWRSSGAIKRLEQELGILRLHLNGWFDKFETIFSSDRRRSLVYLADEKKHGIGFPQGLRQALMDVLRELGAEIPEWTMPVDAGRT